MSKSRDHREIANSSQFQQPGTLRVDDMKRILTLITCCVCVCLMTSLSMAQSPLTVDIHGPGQRMVNLIMLPPKGP